jgi:hypothetical protein
MVSLGVARQPLLVVWCMKVLFSCGLRCITSHFHEGGFCFDPISPFFRAIRSEFKIDRIPDHAVYLEAILWLWQTVQGVKGSIHGRIGMPILIVENSIGLNCHCHPPHNEVCPTQRVQQLMETNIPSLDFTICPPPSWRLITRRQKWIAMRHTLNDIQEQAVW